MKSLKLFLLSLISLSLFQNCKKNIDEDIDFEISVNEQITIDLQSSRSAGYSWVWVNKEAISIVDTVKTSSWMNPEE